MYNERYIHMRLLGKNRHETDKRESERRKGESEWELWERKWWREMEGPCDVGSGMYALHKAMKGNVAKGVCPYDEGVLRVLHTIESRP